jgi:hypothetical protein
MKPHKHFKLIVLWAMGFTLQEKYDWYKDWEDIKNWTPPFDDSHAQLRLKEKLTWTSFKKTLSQNI